MKGFIRKYGLLIIFGGIFLLSTLSSPTFLSRNNLSNLLRQGSIVGILAVGETLVILTGGIDLSLGSMVALASVLVATFMPQSIFLSILLTMLICTALGSIDGVLVAKGKMPPFIATLGMMMVARSLAMVIAKGEVVYGVSKSFYFVGQGYIKGIPVPGVILALVAVVVFFLLGMSGWGRHIYAVGGSEEAARLSGIGVERIKISVYTLSGFFAGLAGLVYTARLTAGYCEGAVGYELDAIAAAVIGGVNLFGGEGNLLKAIVGAFILTIISNFMNLTAISPYTQEAVKGAIILIAVYLSLRR
ncbi:ABC transporter permease [Candidatus Aerophobetes bacterium]|uniref:ABC transporter permease n=1 Tax=Aerophobetes bacterium TaxID=2030807 RepID=A0A662DG78_UNCAE|nr:MAG: ABC transporter permease [Candidatus Aerophobetes bacterium]